MNCSEKVENEEELFLEAVLRFVSFSSSNSESLVTFRTAKGSVNNIIRFVYCDPNDEKPQYVLRIYNNGNHFKKIQFEHLLLEKIQSFQREFQVPIALQSLDEKKETIVKLSNGSYASLFYVIEGVLPGLELTREIGRACGQLSLIFQEITTQLTSTELELISTPPYYDLYRVHPNITRDIFLQEASSNLYDSCREDMNYLIQKIQDLEINLQNYHQHNLPTQLIHGDLHYDNVIVQFSSSDSPSSLSQSNRKSGRVSAIFDYEFCAIDWKAMELAICLSKYLAQPDPFLYIIDFIEGYANGTHSDAEVSYLSPFECSLLPSLVELRILSNVIFFVARIKSQQESIQILIGGKAHDYRNRIEWIERNREKMVRVMLESFHPPLLSEK